MGFCFHLLLSLLIKRRIRGYIPRPQEEDIARPRSDSCLCENGVDLGDSDSVRRLQRAVRILFLSFSLLVRDPRGVVY